MIRDRVWMWIGSAALVSACGFVSPVSAAAWVAGGGVQTYWSDPPTPDAHKTRTVLGLQHSLAGEYSLRLSGGRWREVWGDDSNLFDMQAIHTAADYTLGLEVVRTVPATRTFSASLGFGLVQHWIHRESVSLSRVDRIAYAPLQPEVQIEAQKIVHGGLGVFVNFGEEFESSLSQHDSRAAFFGAGVRWVAR